MNIEFPRITPNLKLEGSEVLQAANAAKSVEKPKESLFSNSLVIKESENFALGDIG